MLKSLKHHRGPHHNAKRCPKATRIGKTEEQAQHQVRSKPFVDCVVCDDRPKSDRRQSHERDVPKREPGQYCNRSLSHRAVDFPNLFIRPNLDRAAWAGTANLSLFHECWSKATKKRRFKKTEQELDAFAIEHDVALRHNLCQFTTRVEKGKAAGRGCALRRWGRTRFGIGRKSGNVAPAHAAPSMTECAGPQVAFQQRAKLIEVIDCSFPSLGRRPRPARMAQTSLSNKMRLLRSPPHCPAWHRPGAAPAHCPQLLGLGDVQPAELGFPAGNPALQLATRNLQYRTYPSGVNSLPI